MLSARALLTVAVGLMAVAWITLPRAASAGPTATEKAQKLVETFIKQFRPLDVAASRAWWDANISGKDEDFARKEDAQNKIDELLSDKEAFKEVKAIKEAGGIDDAVTKRAVDVIYLMYVEKQVDADLLKKMTKLSNTVEQKFNTFRAKVGDKEMTTADVRNVLKDSTLSERRKDVWEASKEVGKVVEPELKELVKLRNQSAKQLGFDNYHALQLYLNEQDQSKVLKLFDQLDQLTREPFRRAKDNIDAKLAANCSIAVAELRPWHYHDPFFQEAPAVFKADLDKIYGAKRLVGELQGTR